MLKDLEEVGSTCRITTGAVSCFLEIELTVKIVVVVGRCKGLNTEAQINTKQHKITIK